MKHFLFYIIAAVILIASVLTVTSARLLRSAVYLLFVLIATAGLYFLMDYTFLAAAQLTLYAGGIIVLIIFSVMLTSSAGEKLVPAHYAKRLMGLLLSVVGFVTCLFTFLSYDRLPVRATPVESSVRAIGAQLVNAGENGYMLAFEIMSLLLLAAMVAAIVIARRDNAS